MSDYIKRRILAALTLGAAFLSLHSVAAPPETVKPIRIGIIGAGSLGGTVGSLLAKAGHEVKFSSRHPEELVSMARELGPRACGSASYGTANNSTVPNSAASRGVPTERASRCLMTPAILRPSNFAEGAELSTRRSEKSLANR